jgi:hypothetical protein
MYDGGLGHSDLFLVSVFVATGLAAEVGIDTGKSIKCPTPI